MYECPRIVKFSFPPPAAPVISVTKLNGLVAIEPVIRVTEYIDSPGAGTWTGTEIQVLDNLGAIVVSKTLTGYNKQHWLLPIGTLASNTTYTIKARYITSITMSEWSSITETTLTTPTYSTAWTELPIYPVEIAYLGVSTIEGSDILVTGGLSTVTGATADVRRMDYITKLWSDVAPLPWVAADAGQSTLLDGRVLVTGGEYSNNDPMAAIYDPALDTWISLTGIPTGFFGHGQVTLHDGRVMLIGGMDSNWDDDNKIYFYNPYLDTWELSTITLTANTSNLQVTMQNNGKVFIIDTTSSSLIAYIYDPFLDTLTSAIVNTGILNQMGLGRIGSGELLTIGGYIPILNQVTVYKRGPDDTDTWAATTVMPYAISFQSTTMSLDGIMYAICGKQDNNNDANYVLTFGE